MHSHTHDASEVDKTRHSLSPPRGHSHARPDCRARRELNKSLATAPCRVRRERRRRVKWRRNKTLAEECKVPASWEGRRERRKARVALDEERERACVCAALTFYRLWSRDRERWKEWGKQRQKDEKQQREGRQTIPLPWREDDIMPGNRQINVQETDKGRKRKERERARTNEMRAHTHTHTHTQ